MSLLERAEKSLAYHFDVLVTPQTPPRLVAAMRHAVFSSGARVRPQLCTAVALACSDDAPGLSDAMGSAIELMHCASLVHDDMPAFDNADTRRGQPTVHKAFGEPLALLTGDALTAQEMLDYGMANYVFPLDRLEHETRTIARRIASDKPFPSGSGEVI